jgi:hypothetical protein
VDEIEDALQHCKCSSECSIEDDLAVPELVPRLGTEQVAPIYHEEARHASRKRTCEDGAEEKSKASKVDDIADIREDIFAEVSPGCDFSVLLLCLIISPMPSGAYPVPVTCASFRTVLTA